MKVDFSSTHLLLCLSSFVLSCLLVLSLSASFSLFAAPFCNEGRRAANCTHRAQLTQMGEKSGHQTLPLVALVCSCLPASQQVLPIVERDEKEKKRLGWWRMANGRRQERERERETRINEQLEEKFITNSNGNWRSQVGERSGLWAPFGRCGTQLNRQLLTGRLGQCLILARLHFARRVSREQAEQIAHSPKRSTCSEN